jgi:PKD repeat protein
MRPKQLLAFCLILAACKKNSSIPTPPPTAAFVTTADTTGGIITLGTYDQYALINTSTDAAASHWDFGNDSASDATNPGISYPRSGTYTLTLTVQNKEGEKRIITKQVKVLDRVMKQLLITGLQPLFWPVNHSLDHASVWAVIRLGENGVKYPIPSTANTSFNAPIVYQSPVITGIDPAKLPYAIALPANMIVNFPALAINQRSDLGYTGVGYGLELYAQDGTGTYLLSSSYAASYTAQSGSITWPLANIQQDSFVIQYGDLSVGCDYE